MVKILFIGGQGRSGSTLLDILLGQIPTICSTGELRNIWVGGFVDNILCSCGVRFRDCPFWTQVVNEAFGGFDNLDIDAVLEAKTHVSNRIRHIPRLIVPSLQTSSSSQHLDVYTDALLKLFQAIKNISGCSIIADSSKQPTYSFTLSQMPDVRLYLLHLIRDSRAVAHSWQRQKENLEDPTKKRYMNKYSPFTSAMAWDLLNTLVQINSFLVPNYKRLRYEDFVADVNGTLNNILTFVEGDNATEFTWNSNEIQTPHMIGGNPMRYQQGPLQVRPDMKWKTEMNLQAKYVVTSVTWPLLLYYGYDLKFN